MVINNLIYNPGPRAVHYNLIAEEWRGQPYQVGQMALIGNVLRAGPSTPPGLALFMLGGSGDIELYEDDNIAVDWVGRPAREARPLHDLAARASCRSRSRRCRSASKLLRAAEVQDAVIRNAGARPWDRDPIDARIVADTIEGRGEIIDSEDAGRRLSAVPGNARSRSMTSEWDLRYMTRRDGTMTDRESRSLRVCRRIRDDHDQLLVAVLPDAHVRAFVHEHCRVRPDFDLSVVDAQLGRGRSRRSTPRRASARACRSLSPCAERACGRSRARLATSSK